MDFLYLFSFVCVFCNMQVLAFLNGTALSALVDVFVTNYTVTGMFAVVEFRVDTFQEGVNSSFVKEVFTDALPSSRTFGSNNRIAEQGMELIEISIR